MNKYCVTFQASHRQFGILVEAETPEIAILRALKLDVVGAHVGVEAFEARQRVIQTAQAELLLAKEGDDNK